MIKSPPSMSATLSQGPFPCDLIKGVSPFSVCPLLKEALENNSDKVSYGDPRGLPQLRETFARSLSSRVGFVYDSESVLVGAGAKAILFLIMASLGKRIVLPRGSWVSYKPQAEMCGKAVHWVPVDQETGKIKDLLLVQGDVLILNSPSNPWGCVYDEDELEKIAEEVYKANAFVVSDDIYWRITHPGVKASPFAAVCPDRTIVVDGLSKWAGAAGWRLGIAAFGKHPDLKEAYDRCVSLSSQIFSCVCLPVQHAAILAFSGAYDATPEVKARRKAMRQVMCHLQTYAYRRLKPYCFSISFPQGGFYIFVPFPRYKIELLNQRGVGVVDGTHFGMRGYIRLSLTNFCGDEALTSELPPIGDDLALDAWVKTYCPIIHEGIAKIIEVISEETLTERIKG